MVQWKEKRKTKILKGKQNLENQITIKGQTPGEVFSQIYKSELLLVASLAM